MAALFDIGNSVVPSENDTISTTLTIGANSNRVLLVAIKKVTGGDPVGAPRFNGVDMTSLGSAAGGLSLWVLDNPPTGANSFALTNAAYGTSIISWGSFYDCVSTGSKVGTPFTPNGTTVGVSSGSQTCPAGALLFGAMFKFYSDTLATLDANGATSIAVQRNGGSGSTWGAAWRDTTGALAWTTTSAAQPWDVVGVAVLGDAPAGDTNAPTITGPTGTGGTLTGTGGITSNEAGTHYWQATTSATPLTIPTSPAAMTGWTSRALTATAQTWSLSTLAAGTYYVHNAAEDATGNRTTTDVVSGSFVVAAGGTAPAITAQPASLTRTAGATATFSVTATGTGLTYQWRRNGTNISGAVSASYTTAATTVSGGTANNGDTFSVVVTGDTAPAATSSNATLTVNAAPSAGTFNLNSAALAFNTNGGVLHASKALTFWASDLTTGALIGAAVTGLSTNASGIVTTAVAPSGVLAGTTYRLNYRFASGEYGVVEMAAA